MRTVVLYSRPRCGLCDEARRELVALRAEAPFELREVNIEEDDALELAYGLRIPVIEVDGREVAEISVDRDAMLDALRG